MTLEQRTDASGFNGLGIAPKLLDVLEQCGFVEPTPIQLKSIPVTVGGQDIVGIAQTGTGKTLAFGVPMLQRLAQHGGKGLVILPTRELAFQVNEDIRRIGKPLGLRTAVLVGGEAKEKQLYDLRQKPHIIVATPGRLIDYLKSNTVKLDAVKILVLDEADMMFDMGFMPQLRTILDRVPKERQTMLFSATMPPEIVRIIAQHMTLPVSIEVAPSGTPAELVSHEMIVLGNEDKIIQLEKTLKEINGSVLIFCRTKHGVRKLTRKLQIMGHNVAEIHSNRSLGQRREALEGFKLGRYRVLVATDIAARGIDVKGIELVLNYDLPEQAEDYVHRIGRTGRAGLSGRAISFALPSQMHDIAAIERLISQSIPRILLAEIPSPVRRSFGTKRKGATTFGRPSNIGTVLKRPSFAEASAGRPSHANASAGRQDRFMKAQPTRIQERQAAPRMENRRFESPKPEARKFEAPKFVKTNELDEFGLSDLPFVEGDVSHLYKKAQPPKQGGGDRSRNSSRGRDRRGNRDRRSSGQGGGGSRPFQSTYRPKNRPGGQRSK